MTIEELEAKLETVSRERDDAHARWVAIINNRGTTISDVETLTNELNIALSQRDKVRVELREARILTQEIGDVCRGKREPSKGAAIILGPILRERDEARAEVTELTKQLSSARECQERSRLSCNMYANQLYQVSMMCGANVDDWRGTLAHVTDYVSKSVRVQQERDEARNEVERLTSGLQRERIGIRPIDEVRCDAYRRGAEAMREACIAWARAPEIDWDALPDVLEEMPIPEEP